MTALTVLGRSCELGAPIALGGMACVYRADRELAVKILRDDVAADALMLERFDEEARIARTIHHPNVVRVLDHGMTSDGRPFVVMDYVRGASLTTLILGGTALTLAHVRSIGLQILAGLAAIHRAGVVHGDMKSDNILVDTQPAKDHVTIIDFGLARPAAAPILEAGYLIAGTPEYMAPELIRGERLARSMDIYAVGVIFYELATGTTPFCGESTEMTLADHLNTEVVPPSVRLPESQIPPAFEAVILRALAKDPADRYPDADSFAHALARALPLDGDDLAATDRACAFSTNAATQKWIEPVVHARAFARGTPQPMDAVTCEPPDAPVVAMHDPERRVGDALATAYELVAQHQLLEAARELERALAQLSAEQLVARSLWRLLLSLAALYDGLDDPARARQFTHAARGAAEHWRNRLGQARANAMLRRLDAASHRSPHQLRRR